MMSSKSARLEYLRCPSLGVRTMSEYKYVAPYTGLAGAHHPRGY